MENCRKDLTDSLWYAMAKNDSSYYLQIPIIKCLEKTRLVSAQVLAAVEHFSKTKKFNGVTWLLLIHWGTWERK